MKHSIVCALFGHQWKHTHGIFLDGKSYPAIDVKRCTRCGDTRTDLFMGGC